MPKDGKHKGKHHPEHGPSSKGKGQQSDKERRRIEEHHRLTERAAVPQYPGLKAIGELAARSGGQIKIIFAAYSHLGAMPDGLIALLKDPSTQVIVREAASGTPEIEKEMNWFATGDIPDTPEARLMYGIRPEQSVSEWLSRRIRSFTNNDPHENSFLNAVKQSGKLIVLEQAISGVQTAEQGNIQQRRNLQEGYQNALNNFTQILPEITEADVLTNHLTTLKNQAEQVQRRESEGIIRSLDRKGRKVVVQLEKALNNPQITKPINIVFPIGAAHISLLEQLQQLTKEGQPLHGIAEVDPKFFTQKELVTDAPDFQAMRRLIAGETIDPTNPQDRELLFRALMSTALRLAFSTTMPAELRIQMPSLYTLAPIVNAEQMQRERQFLHDLLATFSTEDIAKMFVEERRSMSFLESLTPILEKRLNPRRTTYPDVARMYGELRGNLP